VTEEQLGVVQPMHADDAKIAAIARATGYRLIEPGPERGSLLVLVLLGRWASLLDDRPNM
jgi:hypothetical protein